MGHFTRREFVTSGFAVGAAIALPASRARARSVNDAIHLGFVSCGGRANELIDRGSVGELAGPLCFCGVCVICGRVGSLACECVICLSEF